MSNLEKFQNSTLLAKPVLPPDFIDVATGEPFLVRESFHQYFPTTQIQLKHYSSLWEYQKPNGLNKLVNLLEEKHQAPVIVTNGAKQGLSACFHALKVSGIKSIGTTTPFWALLPPLIKHHGLEFKQVVQPYIHCDSDSFLLVAPNNPDGHFPNKVLLNSITSTLKEKNIPIIHDAAYYTPVYAPISKPEPIGDMQVFSISKMLGLSGLRLGYIVCHNSSYYNAIMDYVEMSTVGVSVASQLYLTDILEDFKNQPEQVVKFEKQAQQQLAYNRNLTDNIDPMVLKKVSKFENGMFGWFEKGAKADFEKAKLRVIEGEPFGVPGMVRISLGLRPEIFREVILRLNS